MTKKDCSLYGGQALIEGIMMNGGQDYAMAARVESGDIVYKAGRRKSLKSKAKIFNLPFIRGIISFAEAFISGFSTLSWSAQQAGGEEEKLTTKEIVLTFLLAFAITILVFVIIPVYTASFTVEYLGYFGRSFVEGMMRIGIFLLYIVIIRRMTDVSRIFEYHGAEHKTINTFEAGEALTPENVKKHSRINVRCGTSFILMAMILMIVVFTFVGNTTVGGRILTKILLMPIVFGIAFEVYRLPLKYPNNPIIKALVAPGLALQKLTTKEPDLDEIQVAIVALSKVKGFPLPEGSYIPDNVYTEEEYEKIKEERASKGKETKEAENAEETEELEENKDNKKLKEISEQLNNKEAVLETALD